MDIAALCGTRRRPDWMLGRDKRDALRSRAVIAAARLNHDLTAPEREALADELAAIAMELRA